jgi:phosphinothricin acetyltransferase
VPADGAAIAAVYAPHVRDGYATFEVEAPDAAAMAERMAGGLPWFVAEDGGSVLGYAYAAPFNERAAYRWSVATSVYLADGAGGRGIGGALYARLLGDLAALGYVSAFAGIALPNPASVALHERLGFTPVGVFRSAGFKAGAWHDVGWWQRPLADPPPEPAPPRR